MPDDVPPRVELLERLQGQQARLNDQLLTLTDRLGEEHALYADALALHDRRLAQHQEHLEQLTLLTSQHEEHMARLDALLAAIKDLLERGNGH